MKITFETKNAKDDHLVIIYKHGLILDKSSLLDLQQKQILRSLSNLTKRKEYIETIHYTSKKSSNTNDIQKIEEKKSGLKKLGVKCLWRQDIFLLF